MSAEETDCVVMCAGDAGWHVICSLCSDDWFKSCCRRSTDGSQWSTGRQHTPRSTRHLSYSTLTTHTLTCLSLTFRQTNTTHRWTNRSVWTTKVVHINTSIRKTERAFMFEIEKECLVVQ